jgi:hypothetical protein
MDIQYRYFLLAVKLGDFSIDTIGSPGVAKTLKLVEISSGSIGQTGKSAFVSGFLARRCKTMMACSFFSLERLPTLPHVVLLKRR